MRHLGSLEWGGWDWDWVFSTFVLMYLGNVRWDRDELCNQPPDVLYFGENEQIEVGGEVDC